MSPSGTSPDELAGRAGGLALRPSQGAELAGFELLGELGRGADSVVHRVRRDGRDYALKILERSGPDGLRLLRREAGILAGVRHAGLPRVYEVGEAAGRPYLVKDLVDGLSLARVLAEGPMDAAAVLRLALDLAEPLALIHAAGLVHRDLKPQNIVVQADGTARLIDFGLAVRGTHVAPDRPPAATGQDDADRPAVGTLTYAAPEQSGVLRRPVDHRSDLYALGVVLHECLAGRPPFLCDDVGELLHHHAVVTPPDLASTVPGVPASLAAVVSALLAKDPDDRYQNAEALGADLARLVADPRTVFRPGTHAVPHTQHPLVGRDTELKPLLRRWRLAREGTGGVCVVRGPAGVGASRLADAVAEHAAGDGALVLRAAAAVDDVVPLAPLRRAFAALVRDVERLPVGERQAAEVRIRAAAGTSAPVLAGLSAPLAGLLEAATLEDADRSEQVLAATAAFLTELARAPGGLMLRLDDGQWLEPGTRRVLERLATGELGVRLLAVVAARDDGGPALPRADLTVTVGPLDAAAVTALVAERLPGVETSRTAEIVAARANGNPFVALEYLRALVDAGLLTPSWDTWELDERALDDLDLPGDALDLVLARLRGLGAECLRVLRRAAAVGSEFDVDDVATACGTDVARVLADAVERRIVGPTGGGRYGFLHDRLRESLLAAVPAADAADLHQVLAGVLSRRERPRDTPRVYAIAHHYLAGRPERTPDAAFDALREAGRLATAEHAPDDAVRFLQRAVRLLDEGADPGAAAIADLHLELGLALQRAGRFPDAVQCLEHALALQPEPLGKARTLLLLGEVHRATWTGRRAMECALAGLAVLGHPVPAGRLARVLTTAWLCVAGILVGITGRGKPGATGEERERLRIVLRLNALAGFAAHSGLDRRAIVMFALRSLLPCHRLGSGRDYAEAKATLGFLAAQAGRWRTSRRCLRRAAEQAGRLGDPRLSAFVAWNSGFAAYLTSLDDGELLGRALVEHGRWLDPELYADGAATLVRDAVLCGRTADALTWRRRFLDSTGGRPPELSLLAAVEPSIEALRGDPTTAVGLLLEMRGRLGGHDSPALQHSLVLSHVHLLAEQGDHGPRYDVAAAAFRTYADRLPEVMRPMWAFYVVNAQVRLARCREGGADPEQRLSDARQAVRLLAAIGASPLLRAFGAQARAELHVLEGHPDRAVAALAEIGPVAPDAPLLSYEVARTRARVNRALGHEVEAIRQASFAAVIAAAEGWPHRARWVRSEFGVGHDVFWDGGGQTGGRAGSVAAGSTALAVERRRLAALVAVGRAAARVLDPDELARNVLDETIRILSAERAFLFTTDERGRSLAPYVGRDAAGRDLREPAAYSASLVERVRASGEPLVVAGTDEGVALGARSVALHGLRSILIAPLKLEGRLLGVVYLDSRVAQGIFTAEDAGILMALTTHVATALETARAAQLELSAQAAIRQRDVAHQLHAALQDMTGALVPEEVLGILGRHLATLLPDHRCAVLAHVAAVTDTEVATLLDGPRRWTALPMATGELPVGTVVVAGDGPADALATAAELATTLVAQAMAAYDRAALFARVQEIAVTDELTGLANRRQFFELAATAVGAARRSARPLGVVMLDVDFFTRVNDSYGYPTGDDVIRGVVRLLHAEVRAAGGVAGRFGGEEFAAVLPGDEAPEEFAERLRATIAETALHTGSGPLDVTASLGVSVLSPDDADIADTLARAEAALDEAKAAGRNRVVRG